MDEKTGRCATCAAWAPYPIGDREFYGPDAGKCKSKAFAYDDTPPSGGLAYWDSEGYSAGFSTDKDFGCVNWVKR